MRLSKILLLSFLLIFSRGNIIWASLEKLSDLNQISVNEEKGVVLVKGVIVDSQNNPLIGVTILEKGTSNGTITDFDGNFTL